MHISRFCVFDAMCVKSVSVTSWLISCFSFAKTPEDQRLHT